MHLPLLSALFLLCTIAAAQTRTGPPPADRLANRTFPSIFQAWNRAEVPNEDRLLTMSRHDLIFHVAEGFGLRWNNRHVGLADGFTPESIQVGRTTRAKLLELNPNMILLLEIRYRDAHKSHLPDDHPWWMRKPDGSLVLGWAEGGYVRLDLSNPAFREQVARQAKAAVDSGVVDGVMLDWWSDDEDRPALLKAVRDAIGPKALILVNSNDRQVPASAPYINGLFMECYRSKTAGDWDRIATTLRWAEANLQSPRINCLETWYHESRQDLNLMRATTTLALTQSDGFCLFSDPNELPTPDHLHDWYDFWNRSLGKPRSPGRKMADGSWHRDFEKGTAAYNPMGNQPATINFPNPMRSAATGITSTRHTLPPCDGDIYLPAK